MGSWKTYFCMAMLALTAIAYGLDYINQEKFMALGTFFAALGGMALRAGISKIDKQ